ncbi:MAG: Ig-like domain-containing protein, partial [Ignavibacteria bacterium]|nr:Ig-like domain-containing protein [Ignavibacteria bacterium]
MKSSLISISGSSAVMFLFLFIGGCANQLPPTGGEDDTTPPVVTVISPKPGTVNFKGNTIELEFDEYYDRRSFMEAFFITPKPKGEIDYSWGRTSVEIEFTKPLEKNKTYLFILGKSFKDNHNNALKEPVQFALSTGSRIDNAGISGKVSGKSMDKMYVFAYRLLPETKDTLNPATAYADYYMPVSNDGTYKLNNLAAGDYRLFAVLDNDKNGIFDKEFDRISPAEKDVSVADSLRADNINFISQDIYTDDSFYSRTEFLNALKSDSAGFIHSNIQK